jgi:hypothetical protein
MALSLDQVQKASGGELRVLTGGRTYDSQETGINSQIATPKDGEPIHGSSEQRRSEEVIVAEINKLSVSKVLDKLRSNDAPKKSSKTALEKNLEAADEELERLRAATRHLKPGKRG